MKRFWILAGALVVTLGALWLAMLLGSASFDFRRYTQHERRLRKVMQDQHPSVERLTQGLKEEGTALVTAPTSPEEKERVIAGRGGKKAAELREKAARHPEMRVFATVDMLYFVFFDRDGVMRDFTLVSR
jgi:hypothetical protein